MQAEKLKKKKNTINKGKVKKTIKNVICRPDTVFWPVVTEAEENILENALKKHRVVIPDFKKLHWKELKTVPKNERPKPPRIEKVDGLLIGISECDNALQNGNCSVVLIEALIDPKALVQKIIEGCTAACVPVICLKNLRTMTKSYYGIYTSCLGVEKSKLMELSNAITKVYQNYKFNHDLHKAQNIIENQVNENNMNKSDFAVDETCENKNNLSTNHDVPSKLNTAMDVDMIQINNPYLFRKNKKKRAFTPNNEIYKDKKQFSGQHFIKISDKVEEKTDRKAYMNMILKRMSNNANRVKIKPNKQ